MENEVFKTDYPENYKYWCKGYMGQILACNDKDNLRLALKSWPKGDYKINTNENKVLREQ